MAQKPQTAAQGKLAAAARQARRHLPGGLPPVLFLTDPARTPDPVKVAARLPRGWGVIYRHFGAADRVATARQLAAVARRRGLVLLIAADPQLAKQAGADGVHWPFAQRGEARKWRDRFRLMSVSAHMPRELRALPPGLFDAALVSTVFPSASPSARAPLGALKLRRLARMAQLPVYALGGVTAGNAARIAKAAGLAAIEGIVDGFGG